MYCSNCGREIADNVQFCTYCGARRGQPGSAPAMSPETKGASVSALVWGIVAVVVCQLPLGFIFGIIGQNKAREAAEMGIENGMVKAGRIMSKVGLIVGIVMSVFWV
ncbi:MAG TPA: zinc-ribbon domain-containing protein, partial [Oscillospiraceae bacterium]|nr:zinc-ribbon domain-containing protein [Oscillospiraceae bacterium]